MLILHPHKKSFFHDETDGFKCIINGFKLGINTKAIAWHLLTPSGGERFNYSNELIKINEELLKEWVKKTYL